MIKTATSLILTIFFLTVGGGPLSAQEQWHPVDNDRGVAIYSRELAGHAESEFKGVTIIKQPLEVVGAVLAEIPDYTGWFYECRQAEKILQPAASPNHFLVYFAVDTPWPLWPRDIVYDVEIRINEPATRVQVRCLAVPEPVVPLRKDHVRVTDAELHWTLESIDTHLTRVTLAMRIDVGGAVRGYWGDLGCRQTIYHSLVNLHSVAVEPKYEALGRKLARQYAPNSEPQNIE